MAADESGSIRRPYIKKVVIEGFKTYGKLTGLQEFDPGMNVLVGLNGSGKSNFLTAICFVLGSEKFLKMTTEARRAIVHKGSGEPRWDGYAEIILENMGENVAPGLPPTVSVKRTVGLKVDEYRLNGKRVERDDVVNLFESIGFSRSNPYNIVLQGQVDALTAMSAADRLELIKDIAGASLYDDKRTESLKLLEETKEKMAKVGEVIDSLQEKLDSLDEEKDELSKFQSLDKKRRALEHRVRDLDLQRVQEDLGRIDAQRAQLMIESQSEHVKEIQADQELEQEERKLREATAEVESKLRQKNDSSAEMSDLLARASRLQLEMEDANTSSSEQSVQSASIEAQLKEVTKEIKEKENLLAKISKQFDESYEAETQAKAEFSAKDRRAKELYAKQGRVGQFKTKKERDAHIQSEIAQLVSSNSSRRNQTSTLESDIANLEISAKTLQAQISGRTTRQEELMRAVKDTTEKFEEAKKQRDQWADRRKALWARQQELEQKRLQQKADLLQEKRTLESTMSRDLVSGLEAVERIKARLPPQHKVYQPLIDLITVREEFTTAVEVVAGNSLFHVVVDTDETAAKVLTELLKERAGRVTCIPLNKVRDQSKVAGIELQQDEEAVRMPDEIEYNIVFRPAINQIFGKTLVCSNLDVATRLSRQHNVACVTLDGQQVSIKGALTGGYHDDRTSRLQSAARQRKLTSAIAETEAELQRISQDLLSLEDKITSSINNMAIHERARSEALHTFESFSDTTRTAHRELLATKETLTKRMHSNKENEAMIQANEESIKALEEEKASSKLFEKLSVEESAELHELNITLDDIAHRVTVATTRRADLEAQKSQLENQLGGNLLPKQAELESKRESIKLSAYTGTTSAQSIQSMKDELKKLEQLKADLTKHHASIEETLKALRMKLQDLQKSVERAQANKEQAQTAAVAKTKRLEKLFNSRMTLLAKRDDLLKRIREIGSLPSKATEDVSRMSHDECVEDLKKTKEDLARFGQVNKKALDQYMSFSSEKEKFSERRDHMEKELDAIEKLIARLDMQKDEAIGRTFRGVAGNFASVFKEVCPEGEANLIMKVQKSAEEIIGSQERQQQKPDRYVGIDMSVKFGSKESRKEGQAIRQLSGGQRTMIALSLIFAIQRCDPAPFYLFDEIDPALDDRYRATIASMVRKQSAETQFIIVTHRPEFVSVAQQNYVVSFSNRVSHVDLVDTDTALEVVAQAEKEQEDMLRKQQQGTKRSKAATAAAPSSATEEPKEGAESEDDDEVVKIHPRIEDDEPTQFQVEEEDELLDEPKRRPKRSRPSQ